MKDIPIRKTIAGIEFGRGLFFLDPILPADIAIVSHAHGDHLHPGSKKIFCTPESAAFLRLRHPNSAAVIHEIPCFQTFLIGDASLSFYPAGHMLGSAMVRIVFEDQSYLYTGDFKLEADPSCQAAEIPRADILITETTFANPAHLHPDPSGEILSLQKADGPVILGAYLLGKAQRMIHLAQKYLPEREIRVHPLILPYNNIYSRFGFMSEPPQAYKKGDLSLSNLLLILPPPVFKRFKHRKTCHSYFVTGWKAASSLQKHLYVSDHADWNGILTLISKVEPKQILTVHGKGHHLEEKFRGIIPVSSLS